MKKPLAATLPVLLLWGCASGPDYARPALPMPTQWNAPLATSGQADLSGWWQQFGDASLNRLVDHALLHNHDVRLAAARLREARALLGVADGAARPRLDAGASVTRDRLSENDRLPVAGLPNPANLYRAAFDASWELDLFGGIARSRDAAAAETSRAAYDREAVNVSVSAETASIYLRLRGLQSRIATLDQQIVVARETLKIVEAQVNAGLTSELDRYRARELLAQLEARQPQLAADRETTLRRLGVLTGSAMPQLTRFLAESTSLPDAVPPLPATVPADLLARRADLRAIEQALVAENARVGVAEADRLPRLALSLSAGVLSLSTGNLMTQASGVWTTAAGLTAPLYRGGALDAGLETARSRHEQAAIRYEQATAKAVEEVEAGAIRYDREKARHARLLDAVAADEIALKLALVRYQGGLADFLTVLDAQRQYFILRDEEIISHEQALTHLVSLIKSLGGGWKPASATN